MYPQTHSLMFLLLFFLILPASVSGQQNAWMMGRISPLTPLMHAARRGDIAAVERLLGAKFGKKLLSDNVDHIDVSDLQTFVCTFLHILNYDAEAAKRPSDIDIDLEARDRYDRTALMYAHHAPIVARLLHAGADPTARDRGHMTPLMYAARRGDNIEVMMQLLRAGANFETKDRLGRTAFIHAASTRNSVENIVMLLNANVSSEERSRRNLVALADAIKKDYPNAVRALIEHGAEVNCCLDNNKTPLMYAVERHKIAIVGILLNYAMPLTSEEQQQLSPHDRTCLQDPQQQKIAADRARVVMQWYQKIEEEEGLPRDITRLIMILGGEVSEADILK